MNTLRKTEKMLKSEMNTLCSEEELELEVIQIISKRSVSYSDDDNNGNEIMEAGKQQLESSEIKLLQVLCFSQGSVITDTGNIFWVVLGYRTSSYAYNKLLQVTYCEALADSTCDQVILETCARCSTEWFELLMFSLLMYSSMSHFRMF